MSFKYQQLLIIIFFIISTNIDSYNVKFTTKTYPILISDRSRIQIKNKRMNKYSFNRCNSMLYNKLPNNDNENNQLDNNSNNNIEEDKQDDNVIISLFKKLSVGNILLGTFFGVVITLASIVIHVTDPFNINNNNIITSNKINVDSSVTLFQGDIYIYYILFCHLNT